MGDKSIWCFWYWLLLAEVVATGGRVNQPAAKWIRGFPLAADESRSFQSNSHCWKRMNFILLPLWLFSGMHSSNFLSEAFANFCTFELIFFYLFSFPFFLFTNLDVFMNYLSRNIFSIFQNNDCFSSFYCSFSHSMKLKVQDIINS